MKKGASSKKPEKSPAKKDTTPKKIDNSKGKGAKSGSKKSSPKNTGKNSKSSTPTKKTPPKGGASKKIDSKPKSKQQTQRQGSSKALNIRSSQGDSASQHSQSVDKTAEITLLTKVSVENFPTRSELLTLLDSILEKGKFPKNYTSDNKDTKLTITFKNSDAAYEFIKKANIEKMTNPLYKKLKISMNVVPYSPFVRPKPVKRPIRVMKHTTEAKQEEKKVILYEKEYNKRYNVCTHKHRKCSLQSCSINASSPYIEPYLIERKDNHDNRVRWVGQKNFNAFVGKRTTEQNHYINNFVGITPAVPFVFRKAVKEAWIEPKGFRP